MVPVASVVLTVPFYVMSVVCEYLVVGRFMPERALQLAALLQ